MALEQDGQKILDADVKLMNTINSSDRQPIESFFNWLIEKTGIQDASKVRSTLGLYVHIHVKLAATLIIAGFNFNSHNLLVTKLSHT